MAKHPGGRPTKYRKAYCAALIAHMADGLSYESFAATIDVSRDTIRNIYPGSGPGVL